MALLSSSASFVRYTVEGDLPENFWSFMAERLAAFSFRDIDDTLDEYSIGWVSLYNMFDSTFHDDSYRVADHIALALRVDERKISPAVLKKFCLKEENRLKKERQVPRLNRSQRLEIKERMTHLLMQKATAVPAVYDLCWNLAESTLLFFATSQKAQAMLEDFFKESFNLSLVLQIPYLTAARLLSPAEQEALEGLRPEIFV